jgi:ABC-2 type transport system permease protein
MRLLLSELLRARSRRLVPMLIVAGVLAILVGLGFAFAFADKPTEAEVAQAQSRYERNIQQCLQQFERGGEIPPGFETPEEYCNEQMGPGMDTVQLRDLAVILQGTATFVILFGLLLGASLGGADWTNNTMTTLLTWEPRRPLVFFTRAVVVAVFVGAITAFLQVVFSAIYWVVAVTRGSTMFLPSGFWGDVAATIGRVSAMSVALGLVAYAIAMIGRSTVSSLGAMFGYLVLFEGVIAGFRPSIQGSLLVRGASVIVSQHPIFDEQSFSYETPVALMTVQRAWAVVAVYLLVLGAISVVQYQRRDVT